MQAIREEGVPVNPEDIRQLVQARIGQAVESLEDAQTPGRHQSV